MKLEFRKLKASEISVRVGRVIETDKFKGCSLLLYKDARVDMDILDETVGAMNWQRQHSRENANCKIGIYDTDKKEWVWKEDTGTESNTEAEKGLASDSFKRAGVNWGIGRELYSDSVKNIMVECELSKDGKVKKSIGWVVKEIEYANNEICRLVIAQTTYGKDEKVVYTLGEPRAKADKPFPEVEKPEIKKPVDQSVINQRELMIKSTLDFDENKYKKLMTDIKKVWGEFTLGELTADEFSQVLNMAKKR